MGVGHRHWAVCLVFLPCLHLGMSVDDIPCACVRIEVSLLFFLACFPPKSTRILTTQRRMALLSPSESACVFCYFPGSVIKMPCCLRGSTPCQGFNSLRQSARTT